MRKIVLYFVAVLTVGTLMGLMPMQAQEDSTKTSTSAKAQPVQPYRLDFSFNELMDGKVTNARHYSMNLNAGTSNEIKIGTRVPVAVGANPSNPNPTQYQYMDVGTRIWSQLREHGDELILAVTGEVSNLDTSTGSSRTDLPPVVRQIKITGETLLVTGKPIVVGSMDDPNSKRQFQLEVTVTKLR